LDRCLHWVNKNKKEKKIGAKLKIKGDERGTFQTGKMGSKMGGRGMLRHRFDFAKSRKKKAQCQQKQDGSTNGGGDSDEKLQTSNSSENSWVLQRGAKKKKKGKGWK